MCRLRNIAMRNYQVWLSDRRTDAGQSYPYVPLWFAGDTKRPHKPSGHCSPINPIMKYTRYIIKWHYCWGILIDPLIIYYKSTQLSPASNGDGGACGTRWRIYRINQLCNSIDTNDPPSDVNKGRRRTSTNNLLDQDSICFKVRMLQKYS